MFLSCPNRFKFIGQLPREARYPQVGGSVDSKSGKCSKNAARTHPQLQALLGGSSLPCSITEENRTIAKAAFLQKLKLQSNVIWEALFAASHYDRDEEQMTLVDQP
jgi:hypothetical protein